MTIGNHQIKVGIIGGSGLYQMEGLENTTEITVDTPFGNHSDNLILGTLEGLPIGFLARHGRGHHILPTELPFRANIYALKSLGAEFIISVSAVGSLQEKHKPLDMVIPDQFFDRTYSRSQESTFFGNGIVAHINFADPVCNYLCNIIETAGKTLEDIKIHRGGTYLCMEGPAFSTRAESNVYRSWGMDVIGMTNLQEAKLAREAEMSYATIAMVTDYDCWHEGHDSVTVEMILDYLNRNVKNVQRIIRSTVKILASSDLVSPYNSVLRHAIMTNPHLISKAIRQRLSAIIGKYYPVTN